jgi:hypothetical protein
MWRAVVVRSERLDGGEANSGDLSDQNRVPFAERDSKIKECARGCERSAHPCGAMDRLQCASAFAKIESSRGLGGIRMLAHATR